MALAMVQAYVHRTVQVLVVVMAVVQEQELVFVTEQVLVMEPLHKVKVEEVNN